MRSFHSSASSVLAPRCRSARASAACRRERTVMLRAIDQRLKMPSDWRSPAMKATGAATSASALLPGRSKICSSMRVWPWPARPARPTISPLCAMQFAWSACCLWRRAHRRSGASRSAPSRASCAVDLLLAHHGAHGGDQASARSNSTAGRSATTLAVLHHHDAVAVVEDVAEQMRDQDARWRPPPPGVRTKVSSCLAVDRIERGGRLVQNDQAQRARRSP